MRLQTHALSQVLKFSLFHIYILVVSPLLPTLPLSGWAHRCTERGDLSLYGWAPPRRHALRHFWLSENKTTPNRCWHQGFAKLAKIKWGRLQVKKTFCFKPVKSCLQTVKRSLVQPLRPSECPPLQAVWPWRLRAGICLFHKQMSLVYFRSRCLTNFSLL